MLNNFVPGLRLAVPHVVRKRRAALPLGLIWNEVHFSGSRWSLKLVCHSSTSPNLDVPFRPFHFRAVMQVFSRRTAGFLQAAARKQRYSSATAAYASTAENLRINKDTKVIFQGFTGKQGRYEGIFPLCVLSIAKCAAAFTLSKPSITVFNI